VRAKQHLCAAQIKQAARNFFAGYLFIFRNFAACNGKYMDKLLKTIVEAIGEKKGQNIVSLDLRKIEGAICSYFVVCNADSTTQVGAIAAGIEEKVLAQLGQSVWRVDGAANSLWIAMDYIDIVVHIFQTPLRDFYKLEQLWADAPKTEYRSEE